MRISNGMAEPAILMSVANGRTWPSASMFNHRKSPSVDSETAIVVVGNSEAGSKSTPSDLK